LINPLAGKNKVGNSNINYDDGLSASDLDNNT
jgi:hypothetical protein